MTGPWRLTAIALLIFMTGCATNNPPVRLDPQAVGLGRASESKAQRASVRHILVLSSGGADGAFGAGVLVGWSESGGRPVFDVVSGVSTGALQAPLAFLGKNYDALLEETFTATRTRDVFRSNGVKTFVRPGLNSIEPLRAKLSSIISAEMLAEIGKAHRQGRRLYVTTTDLTNGRAVIWDMGRIASSGGDGAREAFIAILAASAAAPGFVEPVPLPAGTGEAVEMHGDGGVKQAIPLRRSMLSNGARDRVWIIVNGHLSENSSTTLNGASALAVGRRGISQLLRSLVWNGAENAIGLASRTGAAVRLQWIPIEAPEAADQLTFDPIEMRRLFELGRAQGRDAAQWRSSVLR
jgi:predicted acylesterase/phospholipase RssA